MHISELKNIFVKNFIKNKINFSLLIIFILIIIAGILFINLDYYPVISVNGEPITNKKVKLYLKATVNYYENYKNTYENQTNLKQKEINLDGAEVQILNQLIDQKIISQEVKKRLGKDYKEIIEEKIKSYLNSEIINAGKTLLGLTPQEFENEILKPQAEHDVLAGRLFLENQNISNWLKNQRKNAKIIVFNSKFKWNGQDLELNK
jgi:hypothetical protein